MRSRPATANLVLVEAVSATLIGLPAPSAMRASLRASAWSR